VVLLKAFEMGLEADMSFVFHLVIKEFVDGMKISEYLISVLSRVTIVLCT